MADALAISQATAALEKAVWELLALGISPNEIREDVDLAIELQTEDEE